MSSESFLPLVEVFTFSMRKWSCCVTCQQGSSFPSELLGSEPFSVRRFERIRHDTLLLENVSFIC